MRQYIGIIRDHSGSMDRLTTKAMQDYNEIVDEMKSSFRDMESTISVVKCGFRSYSGATTNVTDFSNVNLNDIPKLTTYVANGSSTPLYDAVGTLMQLIQSNVIVDNAMNGFIDNTDYAVLILVITDGQENASKVWYASNLKTKIQELQATDKWTFVFRVPNGYKNALVNRLGIHEGNVVEWEQTEQALAASTYQTKSAIASYGTMRSSGATSTDRFYANTTQLAQQDIKKNLIDVTHRVVFYGVNREHMAMEIRPFVEQILGLQYNVGSVYYQLTKTETLQADKKILVRTSNGHVYEGNNARTLLGFPLHQTIKVVPGNIGDTTLFIQSKSVNRHLIGGTSIAIYM